MVFTLPLLTVFFFFSTSSCLRDVETVVVTSRATSHKAVIMAKEIIVAVCLNGRHCAVDRGEAHTNKFSKRSLSLYRTDE